MPDDRPDVTLATLLHDPHGRWGPRIDELLPSTVERFAGTVVLATSTTAETTVARAAGLGANVVREDHEPLGLAGIGRARRGAVELALRSGGRSHVLYSDLDHVLRWNANAPAALAAALRRVARHDLTVLGRRPDVIAAMPATLRDTEAIVNRVFRGVTGRSWDLLSGVRGLSPRAASLVVRDCREDSIANDVTWPLLALDRRLDVGYVEADGLDYEDDEQFTSPGDRREWVAGLERSPAAWLHRLEIARLGVDAMVRHRTGRGLDTSRPAT